MKFTRHSIDSIIKSDNIHIVFEPNIADPVANLDIDQMMQVLTNLEKNAVEAMPQGGTLTIGVEGDAESVHFFVSDTGHGISEGNMDKVFTPFFTTKESGKGTGLGLPLIYGIVKMNLEKIHLTSNANPHKGPTGTTFKITIPRGTKI